MKLKTVMPRAARRGVRHVQETGPDVASRILMDTLTRLEICTGFGIPRGVNRRFIVASENLDGEDTGATIDGVDATAAVSTSCI